MNYVMSRSWIAAVLLCAVGGGCTRSLHLATAERESRGLVVVLPGIEGSGWLNEAICRGLNDGGVEWGIELYDWTTGVPGNYLYHLRAEHRNRREAALLAERIEQYKRQNPLRPVVLVGQSGGAAIALWAAEAIRSPDAISGIILLAPALSPGYDLTTALGNTQRGIVNFYSPRDWVFLGVGTTLSGTMDGKYTSSAGRLSFRAADVRFRPAYAKLYQAMWNREMSDAGYTGGHLSSGARRFVATYVAPLVLDDKWNEELLMHVLMQDWEEQPRPKLPPPEQWRVEPIPQNGSGPKMPPATGPAGAGTPPDLRERRFHPMGVPPA